MRTNEFLELNKKLHAAGVRPLVVKGIICRNLYPQPDYRQSGDEDVLIPVDQFQICHKVMMDFGMQTTERENELSAAYEVTYRKMGSPLYIELHKAINLRSKETGWSRYQYSNVFEYENGKQHSISSSDSLFMKLFVGDYISRPSCENCKFKGYNRVSDITLGDFWGIWDIDPEMDDNKGTSVVLIQSEKGQALWKEISGKIKFKEVSLEQASRQNPSMLVPSKANSKREEVLKQIREGGIAECENLFVQPKISMVDKIKGKMQRLIYGKRE